MMQHCELPPWLFMLVGMLGFLLARGGITVDWLHTAADTIRTLAMLGVIVLGCIMVLRDVAPVQKYHQDLRHQDLRHQDLRHQKVRQDQHLQQRQDAACTPRMVTISAQQFKTLLDLAAANNANALTNTPAVSAEPAIPASAIPASAVDEIIPETEKLGEKLVSDA